MEYGVIIYRYTYIYILDNYCNDNIICKYNIDSHIS